MTTGPTRALRADRLQGLLRWWPLLAVVLAVVDAAARPLPGPYPLGFAAGLLDVNVHGPAGWHLLAGRWGSVYTGEPAEGPLFLMLLGLVAHLSVWTQSPALCWTVAAGAAALTMVLVAGRVAKALAGDALVPARWKPAAAAVTVLALWLLDLPREVVLNGHWGYPLAAFSFYAAARRLQAGDPYRAGAWLVLAGAMETWAVLAIPVVLVAASWRVRLTALGVAVVGWAAVWLPFVLSGSFTLPPAWRVMGGTVWSWVGVDALTMRERAVQMIVGLMIIGLVAVVAARLLPAGSRWLAWLLALTVVLVRAGTDSIIVGYYFHPVLALAVPGAAVLPWMRGQALSRALAGGLLLVGALLVGMPGAPIVIPAGLMLAGGWLAAWAAVRSAQTAQQVVAAGGEGVRVGDRGGRAGDR